MLEGAPQWTVADQLMKKEVILQGMGWGHMPEFLIAQELRERRLLAISGKHFPIRTATITAARRHDVPKGPVAKRLWEFVEQEIAQAPRRPPERRRGAKKRGKA